MSISWSLKVDKNYNPGCYVPLTIDRRVGLVDRIWEARSSYWAQEAFYGERRAWIKTKFSEDPILPWPANNEI